MRRSSFPSRLMGTSTASENAIVNAYDNAEVASEDASTSEEATVHVDG